MFDQHKNGSAIVGMVTFVFLYGNSVRSCKCAELSTDTELSDLVFDHCMVTEFINMDQPGDLPKRRPTEMGPVRIRHRSHHFATQPGNLVDRAGWQAKMASIEFWIT